MLLIEELLKDGTAEYVVRRLLAGSGGYSVVGRILVQLSSDDGIFIKTNFSDASLLFSTGYTIDIQNRIVSIMPEIL